MISDGNRVICGHLCPQTMQSLETWLMFKLALDLKGGQTMSRRHSGDGEVQVHWRPSRDLTKPFYSKWHWPPASK